MPNILRLASSPIDSFVDYFLDTKPYHTKILEVVETYTFTEEMIVSMEERVEKDVLIENDPLCKETGFGLDYDDKCGYDAIDCCDLFDCFAGYGFIFDNSDMLLNLPVVSFEVESTLVEQLDWEWQDINGDESDPLNEAWLEVAGNFLADKRLQIKRILTTSGSNPQNQLVFDEDVTHHFSDPINQTLTTTFLIVDIQHFDIVSVVDNIVSVQGNHVPFFAARNKFFVLGQEEFNDRQFFYNNVQYNPATDTTELSLIVNPLNTVVDGELNDKKMQIRTHSPNIGIYQSFDVSFNPISDETTVTLYIEDPADLLPANPNPAADDYSLGSVQLRTALNSPRLLTVFDTNLYPVLDEDDNPVLDGNGDPIFENREEELKILYAEYNAVDTITRVFVEGNLNLFEGIPPEELRLRTFGYFFEPGFDGGEECTPPKAENIHTRFYESLEIAVFDGEIPEYCVPIFCEPRYCVPIVCPTPTPTVFGINLQGINESEING